MKQDFSDHSQPEGQLTMNSRKGPTAGKKRESRVGSRKVTSLTAEQLERKRANDREAQRTIRQRTKEHIEHLERRVAELSAKGEQFDNMLRRNAALEAEIARLRNQLAMFSTGSLYAAQAMNGPRRSSTASTTSTIATPYPGSRGNPHTQISSMAMSSRASFPQEWQPYSTSRASPIGEAKSDYTGEVEAYVLEGQVPDPRFNHPITTMSLATNQMDFNIASTPALTPLESYPPTYTSGITDRDDLSQNLQPASHIHLHKVSQCREQQTTEVCREYILRKALTSSNLHPDCSEVE